MAQLRRRGRSDSAQPLRPRRAAQSQSPIRMRELRGVAEHVRPAAHAKAADHLDALAGDAVGEPWILAGRREAQVHAGSQLRIDEPVRSCSPATAPTRVTIPSRSRPIPARAGPRVTSSSIVSRVRSRRSAVGRMSSMSGMASGVATEQQIASGRAQPRGWTYSAVSRRSRYSSRAGSSNAAALGDAAGDVDGGRVVHDGGHQPATVTHLARKLERLGPYAPIASSMSRAFRPALPAAAWSCASSAGSVVTSRACSRNRIACTNEPSDRAVRRTAQRHPGLGGDRGALRSVRLGPVGRQVVLGQGAGDALVVERLEVARRRDVHPPSIALGERPVGDLADEPLDEPVLAALRATVGSASSVSISRRTSARSRPPSSSAGRPLTAARRIER